MDKNEEDRLNRVMKNYLVTRDGFVISKKRVRVMSSRVSNTGYKRVGLCIDGKKKEFAVHRLVAFRWVNNPKNKPCVNHKDGNKLNNDVENLQWVTYKENTNHALENGLMGYVGEGNASNKLKEKEVEYILTRRDLKGRELASLFKVSESMISRIRLGKAWKYLKRI